ncbi:MAG: hypothetical protein IJ092_12235 [Atopobiaceae bacterium]|nr:hypothetical protein [Atopobiaceae bacterium]
MRTVSVFDAVNTPTMYGFANRQWLEAALPTNKMQKRASFVSLALLGIQTMCKTSNRQHYAAIDRQRSTTRQAAAA